MNILSIEEYLSKGKFEIPNYQRGYKWSVKQKTEEKSSVAFFCESIIKAYENKSVEYFIEAVTVVHEIKSEKIILVDGQQRTTTLYLMFIALKEFDFLQNVRLEYNVRKDSDDYLKHLLASKGIMTNLQDAPQDIYYFNEALNTISKHFEEYVENEDFVNYIKKKVKLLFNSIPRDKAVNTFISLNGLKAIMKEEELIKSDLLIQSSRSERDSEINAGNESVNMLADRENLNAFYGREWKVNEDRGRLARNWDKWLYWWNQKEVREYFGTGDKHPLYFLLVTYWSIEKKTDKKVFDFQNFKDEFISKPLDAKINFEGIRKLQKTFEDLYNNFETYNFLGLILKTSSSKEDALYYFLNRNNKQKLLLQEYAKWSLIKATHLEIIDEVKEKSLDENIEGAISIRLRKAINSLNILNERFIYWDENDNDYADSRKELAFQFLTYLNLIDDNNLKRKFNFSIWHNRSLEHIYPKSKKNQLNFDQVEYAGTSIHCIGNLVLLYGGDNSSFGAKDFEDKKKVYFDTRNKAIFKSRNLLHTLSVFANAEWREKEILENKNNTINTLKSQYGIK